MWLSYGAKLTPKDVRAIREALADGETGTILAARYGVTRGMISHIRQGRTWRRTGTGNNENGGESWNV